jgi:Clostripain family
MSMPFALLLPEHKDDPRPRSSILLAVYAAFGGDRSLSTYPPGASGNLVQHPLFTSLLQVAKQGVHVCALIDLFDQPSFLVEVEAGKPESVKVTPRWKHRMDSRHNLAGFLEHAHRWQPEAALVLALEGHGAGYWPDVDGHKLAQARQGEAAEFDWVIRRSGSTLEKENGDPINHEGAPTLSMRINTLPPDAPGAPGVELPMSTWALGAALNAAHHNGVPKLRVIHFNNCFNMSAEVLHTVAPYADHATGYPNYNFFTSGQTYPKVFERLRQKPESAQTLARLFAEENQAYLNLRPNHPTAGCVVDLARMREVADRLRDMANALVWAMVDAPPLRRQQVTDLIQAAIVRAVQYDANADNELETPDDLTDLGSLAYELSKELGLTAHVQQTAAKLLDLLKLCKQYGDSGVPWMNFGRPSPGAWDFSSPHLAMNIFLPDPLRKGVWDWRSPYYLEANPGPDSPQRHAIEFPKLTHWLDFIVEYHRETKFAGLARPRLPEFPVFDPAWETPVKGGCGKGDSPQQRTTK